MNDRESVKLFLGNNDDKKLTNDIDLNKENIILNTNFVKNDCEEFKYLKKHKRKDSFG